MPKKKVNPHRQPVSRADVSHAFEAAKQIALKTVLYTLKESFSFSTEDLRRFATRYEYVLDSVARGYITGEDLEKVLEEEYNTTVTVK